MARAHPKRLIVIGIMTANADKPMAEVVPMIQNHPEVACSPNQAKAWYKWIVERDMAPGKIVSLRTPKEKAATPSKEETVDYATVAAQAADELIETEADVEAERAANLAKIKAAADDSHVEA